MNNFAGNTRLIGINQGKGFTISILVHLMVIGVIISTTSNTRPVQKIMVVDFSILDSSTGINKVKPIIKQSIVSAQPVVQPVKKNTPTTVHKTVVRKKTIPKPPAIITAPEPKVTAIKKTITPRVSEQELKPEPEEELITADHKINSELSSLATTHEQEKTTHLAQTQPKSKQLFDLPAPAAGGAGKSIKSKDSTAVSKYTSAHFSHIQKGIQQHIKYPRLARRMGWEGKVVVEFIVCKDGSVKDILIVESSGYKALDKNAVSTIKKVAPFPIPPIAAKLIIPVVYRFG